MRVRLRDFPTPEEFAQIYDHPYDHTRWDDHRTRVAETVRIVSEYIVENPMCSAADLSCGDGGILKALDVPSKTFGDFVSIGSHLDIAGHIENTIGEISPVDFFVLSETLEHLENPDDLVAQIRMVTDHLLVTTPLGEINHDNPEHIWGWDQEGVAEILIGAGFDNVHVQTTIPTWHYTYQVWIVS